MFCKDYREFVSELARAGNWAYMAYIRPKSKEYSLSGEIRDFLEALLRDEEGWIGINDELQLEFQINMNDIWGWGCADWQEVRAYELPEVYALYLKYNYYGLYAWAAHKSGHLPAQFRLEDAQFNANFYKAYNDIPNILEEFQSYTDQDYEFYIPDKAFLNTEKNHEN